MKCLCIREKNEKITKIFKFCVVKSLTLILAISCISRINFSKANPATPVRGRNSPSLSLRKYYIALPHTPTEFLQPLSCVNLLLILGKRHQSDEKRQ